MDQSKLKREDFSYKHDRLGFTMYYRGRPIGGLGAIRDHYISVDASKEADEYKTLAEAHIKMILNGDRGNYKLSMRKVDKDLNIPSTE